MKSLTVVFTTGLLAVSAVFAAAGDQASTSPERFTGRLIDTGGTAPGRSSTYFTLHIDGYTTDQEAQSLAQLLKSDGQDALLKALWEMEENGWVKIGVNLGYQVVVIRSLPTPEGRVIRVLTDRPIQMAEVMNSLRSKDYPFGVIELKLGPDGTVEAVVIPVSQADFNEEGALEITAFGTRPFRIIKVKPENIKKEE
jgi:hypothetical protein